MIKLIPFFLLSFLLTAHAQILDDDFDGVENSSDLCPNSALTDIVDETGCIVEKLQDNDAKALTIQDIRPNKSQHHFDITLGYNYTKYDENDSQSAQSIALGYYYKNFSAYLYTSNYTLDSGGSGMDDTMLSFYYRVKKNHFSYQMGVGSYIPTDNTADNKTDYFIKSKFNFYINAYNIALTYQHTFMQDDFVQDTNRYILSCGYIVSDKSYLSLTYTNEDSIYEDEDNLQDFSLYGSLYLTRHWFITSSLSFGLSDSASDFTSSFTLGYYF